MARNVANTITFTFRGVDNLSSIASKVSTSLDSISKSFGRVERSSKGTAKNSAAVQQTLSSLQSVAAQLANSLTPVANAVAAANIMVGDSLNGVTRKAEAGKGAFATLAGAYNTLIVAQRAAGFIAAGIKPAMDLETAMTDLKVATGLGAEQIDILTRSAMTAAERTVFTPPEAIEAAKTLNLTVRDVKATTESLLPVLMMAQTYMGKDVKKAAELAAVTMGAFHLQASALEPTLNKLVALSRAVGVPMDKLTGGMGKLGVAASLVGSNFEDIAPAYAIAIRAGLRSEEAATGLKTAMGRLTDPKVRSGLERNLGVIAASGGSFESVTDFMISLAAAADKYGGDMTYVSDSIRQAFGDRAVKPIMANIQAMNQGMLSQSGAVLYGAEAWKYTQDEMRNSAYVLRKANEEAMKPLSAQLARLAEAGSNLLGTVFKPLAGVVGFLADKAAWLVSAIREGIASGTWWGKVLQVIATGATYLGGTLVAILVPLASIAASGALIGAAFGWLISGRIGIALVWVLAKLKLVTLSVPVLTSAIKGVGAAASIAGWSLRRMFLSFLGPIGLAIGLVATFWPYLKKFLFGATASKLEGEKIALGQSAATYSLALKESSRIQNEFAINIAAITQVVSKLEAIEKAKVPLAPGTAFDVIPKMLEKMAALPPHMQMPGTSMAALRQMYEPVAEIKRMIVAGKRPDVEQQAVALENAKFLQLVIQSMLPGEDKAIKSLEALSKALESAVNPTNELRRATQLLVSLGVGGGQSLQDTWAAMGKELPAYGRIAESTMALRTRALEKTGVGPQVKLMQQVGMLTEETVAPYLGDAVRSLYSTLTQGQQTYGLRTQKDVNWLKATGDLLDRGNLQLVQQKTVLDVLMKNLEIQTGAAIGKPILPTTTPAAVKSTKVDLDGAVVRGITQTEDHTKEMLRIMSKPASALVPAPLLSETRATRGRTVIPAVMITHCVD